MHINVPTPSNARRERVPWRLSVRTRAIVSAYADYMEWSEEQLLDFLIDQLAEDTVFHDKLKTRKNNKRWIRAIYGEAETADGNTEAAGNKG